MSTKSATKLATPPKSQKTIKAKEPVSASVSASVSETGVKLTPLLRQFYDIKARYPDKILFFRMGDFFEMFGDDAVKAAPILGIALTRRGQAGAPDLPLL